MAYKIVLNALSGKFDLVQDVSWYVPYTGATTDVDLGANKLTTDRLQLSLTPTPGAHGTGGKMYWDTTWKTGALELEDDVTLQMGQETMAYVYNGTGSALSNGAAVYISGSQSGVPSVSLAKADADATAFVLGLVTSTSIPNGEYGYVTIRGHVNDVNTNSWTVGDSLYLSETTAGALTNTAPSAGNYDVRVGRVMIKDASAGRIYVNIRQETKLTDLADVTITTPIVDQVLRYNGSEWVNSAGETVSGGMVSFYFNDTQIIGTGANNVNEVTTLSKTPDSAAEVVDSWACTSNTVLGEAYLYNTALGRTTLPAGVWVFNTYASVSSVAGGRVSYLTRSMNRVRPSANTVTTDGTGTSRTATASAGTDFSTSNISTGGTLITDSYLQTPQGLYRITARTSDTVVTISVPTTYANESGVAFSVWKSLFNVQGNTITATGTNYTLFPKEYTQQTDITVAATDKLGCIMFATSNNTTTVNFVHSGSSHNSYIVTPFTVLHGNLPGLQGGTGSVPTEEYYHLTSAQHTVATQAATNSVNGYLTSTDWSTFNGKQAALTFGIANTNKVQIDSADVADNDYAKFTASGLEGRSYAEVLSDIGAAPTASPTFTGTVTAEGDIVVGKASSATGQISFKGTTSGTVILKVAAEAGSWTMTLPANDGGANQVLTTNGSGVCSWADAGAGSTDVLQVQVFT